MVVIVVLPGQGSYAVGFEADRDHDATLGLIERIIACHGQIDAPVKSSGSTSNPKKDYEVIAAVNRAFVIYDTDKAAMYDMTHALAAKWRPSVN